MATLLSIPKSLPTVDAAPELSFNLPDFLEDLNNKENTHFELDSVTSEGAVLKDPLTQQVADFNVNEYIRSTGQDPKLVTEINLNNPNSPIPKSPLSLSDSLKLGLAEGNETKKINFLEKNYGQVNVN